MKAWLEQLRRGAQWYDIPDAKRTSLQRLAHRSLGIATLPNIATVLGAGVAIAGVFVFQGGAYFWGLFLVWFGRACDLLDGFLARRTKTSSPFGEGLDAATDKLVILIAGIVLVHIQVISLALAVVVLFEQLGTSMLTLLARRRDIWLHPTRLGKYTMFGLWIMVLVYLLAFWLDHTAGHSGEAARIVADCLASIVIAASALSVWRYLVIFKHELKTRQSK